MSGYVASHFCLYGDFDTRGITAALSIVPSSTIEKGEPLEIAGETVPSRIADWSLYGPEEMSLNEQLDFLVSTLWGRAAAVKELTSQHKADIVVVFANAGSNTITVKPDALKKLADLNIMLTCDRIEDEVEDAD
ncbi:MAG TPA: DUF4279 domain-containing protein [Acidobacteriaceae bacterium]|jgi:hypothetical protein|nr:DUF4279 domain-containing protein [Acidobacteriaceae bacterium]